MLYSPFKNYAEFKVIFGMTEHGNGIKSRKNLILLKYIKTPAIRKLAISTGEYAILRITNMAALKKLIFDRLQKNEGDLKHTVRLINYTFHSDIYETDGKEGSCVDGDRNAIRYIKHEPTRTKVYKMKAGKFIKALISEHHFGRLLPSEVVNWLSEEFTMEWISFSGYVMSENQLFVNKEFGKIYKTSECDGNFGSCMVNRSLYGFYRDYVDASAAYLENSEGKVIARCIIFNEVFDEDGKVWRFAERQYSTDGSDLLKRTLINALIRGGYIDCYKQIGAGCNEPNAIVDIYGNSLSEKNFHIKCTARDGDILSYQDTFKWLNCYREKAYNYDDVNYDYCLDSTYGRVGADEDDENDDRPYDEYHDRYCEETVTVWMHGSEYNCDVYDLDDFIQIGDDYVYCEDVLTCPECGIQFDKFDHNFHSELTGEDYCCQTCLEDAETEYEESRKEEATYELA